MAQEVHLTWPRQWEARGQLGGGRRSMETRDKTEPGWAPLTGCSSSMIYTGQRSWGCWSATRLRHCDSNRERSLSITAWVALSNIPGAISIPALDPQLPNGLFMDFEALFFPLSARVLGRFRQPDRCRPRADDVNSTPTQESSSSARRVLLFCFFAIFRVGEWRADEIDAFLSFFFLSSRMTFFA